MTFLQSVIDPVPLGLGLWPLDASMNPSIVILNQQSYSAFVCVMCMPSNGFYALANSACLTHEICLVAFDAY